ncbi:hypothetical protein [Arthrobacter pigmenti]
MTEHQADRDADPEAERDTELDQEPHSAGSEDWEAEQDDAGNRPQAYAGPFTLRDVVVLGSVALMFIGSLIPVGIGPGYYNNLWNSSSLFFVGLGIVLPLVVAALFIVRRVSGSNPRIGSLSVDQFGSVVALFAAAYFFIVTAYAFGVAPLLALIGGLGLVAATTLAPHLPFFSNDFAGRPEATAHVMARASAIPAPKPPKPEPEHQDKSQDQEQTGFGYGQSGAAPEPGTFGAGSFGRGGFAGAYATDQDEDRERQAAAEEGSYDYSYQSGDSGGDQPDDHRDEGAYPDQDSGYPVRDEGWDDSRQDQDTGHSEWSSTGTAAFPAVGYQGDSGQGWGRNQTMSHSFGATRDSYYSGDDYGEEETYEAFWFAVGQPREIVDEYTGAPEFTIEPGAWVLALQDRGDEFLVQHTDGRVGVLRDLSNIERA